MHALKGVSLAIREGEFVAIMGTSGSGKSTLMNILGCLDRPTSGTYMLDGIDVSAARQRRARRNSEQQDRVRVSGLQSAAPDQRDRERRACRCSTRVCRRPSAWIAAAEALALVGLAHREDSYPNQLSGGQQQRVAIARALVNNPSLILADEPTGNLDSRTSVEVMSVFQRLNREPGITIVLVTHEPDIAQYAERVIVVRDGLITTISRSNVAMQRRTRTRRRRSGSGGIMIGAVLKIALRALARNKGRSALTMLGIIIGVASVIAMVGLGQGAQKQVQQQIESMGTNMLIISAGSQRTGGVRGGAGTSTTLHSGRSGSDPARCSGGLGHQSERQRSRDAGLRQRQLEHSRRRRGAVVSGDPQPVGVASGEFFTDADVRTAARVAVIGETVARELFGGADPVGQTIRVRNLPFRVVGVLAAKGQTQWGQDQDDTVLIPYTTAMKKLLSTQYVPSAYVSAASTQATFEAETADRRHSSPAAQYPRGSGGRLQRPQPDRCRRVGGSDDARHDDAARQHRGRVAAGGRHRHHEHHAGLGHRADARDRDSHGCRREVEARANAVPAGIAGARTGGRDRRNRAGHRAIGGHLEGVRLAA